MKKASVIVICAIAVILPYIGIFVMKNWYEGKMSQYQKSTFIIIDKGRMNLSVHGLDGEVMATFPMGCGKAYGNKVEEGDNRTPEGIFRISDIQNASEWKHDFNDGKGEIKGAYGSYFLRLGGMPHKGIGIHGTHLPSSIGTRCTEGCIRLKNEDISKLKEMVYCGLTVIVLPSDKDIIENNSLR
ncbi:MAG: L,D-transpeptidase [Lachnospiraceae bacterium]|nr:L,D-transpeptidase [Lachnospiraceae bacterium]